MTARASGRRRVVWGGLLLLLALVAWIVAPALTWRPLSVTDTNLPDAFVRVSGVAHVHTTHSDGSGTVDEVMAAAAEAGLDYVIVTDHNTLAGKPLEGYGDRGVLTIIGTEISSRQGHLLTAGLPAVPYQFSEDALDTLYDLDSLGAVTFAAHPMSPREGLRWEGWDLPGDWGLEIYNGDSVLRTAGWLDLAGAVLRYPLNPRYAMLRLMERPATLDRWDALLRRRPAAAIVGADAHGAVGRTSLAPFSYAALFDLARNHVLLDRPLTGTAEGAAQDAANIVTALGRGRTYIGVDALAPADRFFFVAERNGRQWTMGDVVPAAPGPVRLRAGGALPAGSQLTLYRDGTAVATATGGLDETAAAPGIYRVEVGVPGWDFPWIVANPIAVLDDVDRVAWTRAAALPPPADAEPRARIDPVDVSSPWVVASDASSDVDDAWLADAAAPDGSAAARLSFRIGTPSREHPSPFAALGLFEAQDLSGRQGLTFAIRARTTQRLWVQVRDRNPNGAEGTESWFASVKAEPEWRRVTLPFARLHSVAPGSDGALDLDAVAAVVFLVDVGAVAPGTAGTVWIDDLGVY